MDKRKNFLIIFLIIIIILLTAIVSILAYDKFVINKDIQKDTVQIYDNEEKEIEKNIKVEKVLKEKDYVYTIDSKLLEKTQPFTGGKYRYNVTIPSINLDCLEVKKINDDIKLKFNSELNNFKNGINDVTSSIYYLTYNYYLDGNILSLLIMNYSGYEMNATKKYYSYNININTGKEITISDLIKNKGYDYDLLNNKFKTLIKESKDNLSEGGFYTKEKFDEVNINTELKDITTFYNDGNTVVVYSNYIDVFDRGVDVKNNTFIEAIKLDGFESLLLKNK
jgi:hypothetical protein